MDFEEDFGREADDRTHGRIYYTPVLKGCIWVLRLKLTEVFMEIWFRNNNALILTYITTFPVKNKKPAEEGISVEGGSFLVVDCFRAQDEPYGG